MSKPTKPNGLADGPEGAAGEPERPSKPEPEKAGGTAVTEAYSQPSAPSLVGIPGSLPLSFCTSCKVDVKPKGKGNCPRCGRPVLGAFLGRKYPVNVLRVNQLHAEIVLEYSPTTLESRDACWLLAKVMERLDTTKAETTEHLRLLTQRSDLTTQLREAKAVATNTPSGLPDLDTLDGIYDAIERTTRALEMLELLRRAREPEVANAAHDALSTAAAAATTSDVAAPATEPAPKPCPYCHRHPCIGRDHHAFDILHFADPAEVERRRQKSTAEMFESLRREGGR